ncbi:hypothetical protein Tco_0492787 [Tanacetum coccineum]
MFTTLAQKENRTFSGRGWGQVSKEAQAKRWTPSLLTSTDKSFTDESKRERRLCLDAEASIPSSDVELIIAGTSEERDVVPPGKFANDDSQFPMQDTYAAHIHTTRSEVIKNVIHSRLRQFSEINVFSILKVTMIGNRDIIKAYSKIPTYLSIHEFFTPDQTIGVHEKESKMSRFGTDSNEMVDSKAMVEFQRISLTGFCSYASRSQIGASQSRQSTE